ncbi:MAG: putative NAD-dependent epimerase/dehydratase family protein [Candidatus Latescibacterota bacterium]
MIQLKQPYLLFLGDAADQLAAKTANGIARWRPEWCVGQLRLTDCKADIGLPDMSLEEGRQAGAQTLIAGVANRGGTISALWREILLQAVDLGYDIASGLHTKLSAIPDLAALAAEQGVQLADVRYSEQTFTVGNGLKRTGKRLLTVGTDCSVGKMFTALALEREMKQRSLSCTFRASGQTGIFIAGTGISVDAVVSDFVSGATETLSPANDPEHWDLVEGQGSLFHASYAGVSLGLLHGSQPDCLVLCHDPDRTHMRGLPDHGLPSIAECIRLNEQCGRLTNPHCRTIGIAVNTSKRSEPEALELLDTIERETGLPCIDPVRQGAARLVDALL